MIQTASKWKRGFTLVEILIVIAILGVIMGVVYSVYLTHQKSAYTQEEVVEVQQNLRIAMESITKDIRMAGMLVPSTTPPIAAASTDSIFLNMASARGVYAMIDETPDMSAVAGIADKVAFKVKSSGDVDVFKENRGNPVRLIRPIDCTQPISATFSIYTSNGGTTRSMTLQKPALFASGDSIKRGDMIAMTETGAPDPNTVKYSVVNGGTVVNSVTCPQNQKCLVRIANCTDADATCYTNGTSNIIAGNISNLQFSYMLNDSSETDTPTDLGAIRAVRVTITGQTSSTSLLSGGPKTRQLTSVMKIRNRR